MMVHNTESRDPSISGEMVMIQGRMIPANLGEQPYNPNEWASLQKFISSRKDVGVMDLMLSPS
ncbi:hypothetical protein F4779DRAFT_607899 [Xylariaceae sp. FL0662B]|nr:hypothetical protein F4779DRAFT_607899 [Xylariaceae sp. FL0662B]